MTTREFVGFIPFSIMSLTDAIQTVLDEARRVAHLGAGHRARLVELVRTVERVDPGRDVAGSNPVGAGRFRQRGDEVRVRDASRLPSLRRRLWPTRPRSNSSASLDGHRRRGPRGRARVCAAPQRELLRR